MHTHPTLREEYQSSSACREGHAAASPAAGPRVGKPVGRGDAFQLKMIIRSMPVAGRRTCMPAPGQHVTRSRAAAHMSDGTSEKNGQS